MDFILLHSVSCNINYSLMLERANDDMQGKFFQANLSTKASKQQHTHTHTHLARVGRHGLLARGCRSRTNGTNSRTFIFRCRKGSCYHPHHNASHHQMILSPHLQTRQTTRHNTLPKFEGSQSQGVVLFLDTLLE